MLRGHVRDEVVLEGRIVTERWAISKLLTSEGEIDAVLILDSDAGLQCLDPTARSGIEGLLSRAPVDHDGTGKPIFARLGRGTPVDLAITVRTLLRQNELAVAILLDDLDVLFDASDEQARRAIALLRHAASEAECIKGRGPQAPRNVLIALDEPTNAVSCELARLPGVRVLQIAPPDRDTRTAVLTRMAPGFYGMDRHDPEAVAGLQLLADRMVDASVRELEQLRRLSHETRTPPRRPATLLTKLRTRAGLNPVLRVGVENVMRALEESVVGQPTALAKLRTLLEQACSPSAVRPYASVSTKPMMVVVAFGPAGVGKTETARTLARVLFGSENACISIDCGQYANSHDVARLTGAPPGYVGHESGGELTGPLRRGPAVVLFDEIEKPKHGELAKLLLSILEEGRLTDGRGETVTFEQSIVILTTNLGSEELHARYEACELPPTAQFLKELDQVVRDRISKAENGGMGRPELLSRVRNDLVPYDYLRDEALHALTKKYCANTAANLGDEFDVALTVDSERFAEEFAEKLAGRRGHGSWDGRAVERLTREHLEQPLRGQLRSFSGVAARVIPDGTGQATIIGSTGRRRSRG